MTEMTMPGPCAAYEFGIVELHEGALGPDEARQVRKHLQDCACCRDWQARYASLDATLARQLPRPVLSGQFAEDLRERIAGLAGPTTRHALRAVVESEHDWMLRALKRRLKRQAIQAAAAGVATASACIALAVALGPQAAVLLSDPGAGNGRALLGAVAAAAVVGALAWSSARGVLPGLPRPG